MYKLRVSYSLLMMYSQGRIDDMVKYYFKLDQKKKDYEELGIEYHKNWQEYIEKNKEFPKELGGGKLKNPKCEVKLCVQGGEIAKGYEWLELVGMIDCLDEDTVHEFKSGVTSIGKYEKSEQMAIYALLASRNGYDIKKLIIHHYDQTIDKSEISLIWYTKYREEEAINFITTLSYEIDKFFKDEGLYQKYYN